jgi:hypothetical protein
VFVAIPTLECPNNFQQKMNKKTLQLTVAPKRPMPRVEEVALLAFYSSPRQSSVRMAFSVLLLLNILCTFIDC